MKEIFVNLKRFDVPKMMGGFCPCDSPVEWIQKIVKETIELGIGKKKDLSLTYFLPEALLVPAQTVKDQYSQEEAGAFALGCQGVFRQDVKQGGNFGAFTANRPAAAIAALGYEWTMIGHSEERKDKLEILSCYDEEIAICEKQYKDAAQTVETLLNQEVISALERDMNVLFCIGETEQQKGGDNPKEYEPRVKEVLKAQITEGLKGVQKIKGNRKIVIGYEPIWAIGPGKIPPNADYIRFVSDYIKEVCREYFKEEFPVVYGGGLKEENAEEIASVESIDGGLVALTKFDPPIGFDVESLKRIVEAYVK